MNRWKRGLALLCTVSILAAVAPFPYVHAQDVTNPTLSSTNPVDGSSVATPSQNLVLVFSEVVNTETGNISIYRMAGEILVEDIDVTSAQVTGNGTNVITVDLTDPLLSDTEYYVQIDSTAFDDTSGNSYAGIANKTTWNFTTAEWYGTNWMYRKKGTVDETKVPGATTLSNFAVLVSMTDPDLRTTANGGYVEKSAGEDIVFTHSDGTTITDYYLEEYEPTTGEIVAWVRLNVSATTDTDFYLYYGNSSATDASNEEDVWNGASNYRIVHDFRETSGTIYDSTDNNFDGTASGSPTYAQSGKIGNAMEFDGVDDYFELSSNPLLHDDTTLSAWVYKNSTGSYATVFSMSYVCSTGRSWERYTALTRDDMYFRNKKTSNCDGGSVADVYESDDNPITPGNWHHIAVVVTDNQVDSRVINFYVDGTLYSQTQTTDDGSTHGSHASQTTRIGSMNQEGGVYLPFDGKIDHLTFSLDDRSADWITAEYNAQNSPSTFVTFESGIDRDENGGYLITGLPSVNHTITLAQDSNTDLTAKKRVGTVETRVNESGVPVVDATVDLTEDRTFASVTADSDGDKVAVKFSGNTGHTGAHNIYAPYNVSHTQFRVCPNAENVGEVTSACSGGVTFQDGETKTVGSDSVSVNIVTIDSTQYWRVSGITGSGGQGEGDNQVPDMSWWMVLLVLLLCGWVVHKQTDITFV